MNAIEAFHKFKAAGPDGHPACVYHELGPAALQRLCNLYQACFTLAYTPMEWRKSNIIFIPKPGKSDYAEARAFRPISLSNVVLKIMERVILRFLNAKVFSLRPLHQDQHAFRRGRSTESALSNMVEFIETAFDKKETTLGIYLDIQGAFDNVLPHKIVEGLKAHHTPPDIIRWYSHYLTSRQMSSSFRGHTISRFLTKGTPQGGILSPLMWNVCFDPLLQKFQDGMVRCIGFADDGALITSGKNLAVMHSRMQKAVLAAEDWGRDNELRFSTSKTVAVHFTRSHRQGPPPEVKMNDQAIPYSTEVKYLGILLDQRLNWSKHIRWKISSAKALMIKVRSATGRLWGLPPMMGRWAYTGVVRPMLPGTTYTRPFPSQYPNGGTGNNHWGSSPTTLY